MLLAKNAMVQFEDTAVAATDARAKTYKRKTLKKKQFSSPPRILFIGYMPPYVVAAFC